MDKKTEEQLIKIIAKGIDKGFSMFCVIPCAIMLGMFVFSYFLSERDSTDGPNDRSGMALHVDNATLQLFKRP